MKQKLSPEEKAEQRLLKKQWSEFIRRMMKKGAIVPIVVLLFLTSCGTQKPIDFSRTYIVTKAVEQPKGPAKLFLRDRRGNRYETRTDCNTVQPGDTIKAYIIIPIR